MESIDREKFGAFVAQRRKTLGLTQQALADRLFLSNKAVSKWETGQSLPDIDLLQPLADCLQVSVAELLRGELLDDAPLAAEEAKTLVEQTLRLAKERETPRLRRWRLGWALSAALGWAEVALLLLRGWSWAQLANNVLVVETLSLISGLWAVFFAPARLPNYYDENRITAFQQGPVRLNLAGIRIHNGNWPHILAALRWWAVVAQGTFPLFCALPAGISPQRWAWMQGLAPAVALLGLLIPVLFLAKRYE